jgi:hypothetical protein
MANSIVIVSITSQGDSCIATGTVNGTQVSVSISRTVLNSLATAILAQQYIAFKLLDAAPQLAGAQLPISVIPATVNL